MYRRRANDRRAFGGSPDRAPVVAAVLPAYKTASSIRAVIEQIPVDIRHVIVVDDASPDGVGAAMKTGFAKALIRRDRLADRFLRDQPSLRAHRASGIVVDVDMHPRYGDDTSSLSQTRTLFEYSGRLLGQIVTRIGSTYFLRDFTVVSVFISAGVPLMVFGVLWSAYHWYRSVVTNVVASTGTVMIGMLAIILAFQLLLQAVVLDVQNEPGRLQR